MDGIKKLTEFLVFLRKKGIVFSLHHFRDEAITVCYALVGERYEVYFFEDHEEYSVFTGNEAVELGLEEVIRRAEEGAS